MLASWLFLTPKSAARLSERLPIVVKLRVSWASEPTVGEAFKLQTSKNSVLYVTSQGCYVVGGWVGGAISERSTGFFVLKRLAEVAWRFHESLNNRAMAWRGLQCLHVPGCWVAGCCFDPHSVFQVFFFSPFPTLSRRYQPIGICVSKKHVHQVPMFHQQFQRFSQFRIKLFRSPRFTVSPTHITSLKLRPGATPTGSLRGELQGLLTARPFSWQNLLIYYARINFSMIWGARETHRDIFCPLEYLPLLLRESRNVPELQAFSALVSSAVYLSNEAIFVGPGRRPCW